MLSLLLLPLLLLLLLLLLQLLPGRTVVGGGRRWRGYRPQPWSLASSSLTENDRNYPTDDSQWKISLPVLLAQPSVPSPSGGRPKTTHARTPYIHRGMTALPMGRTFGGDNIEGRSETETAHSTLPTRAQPGPCSSLPRPGQLRTGHERYNLPPTRTSEYELCTVYPSTCDLMNP
jgi:hypothetical protein